MIPYVVNLDIIIGVQGFWNSPLTLNVEKYLLVRPYVCEVEDSLVCSSEGWYQPTFYDMGYEHLIYVLLTDS